MSPKHETSESGAQRVPVSAVYRQLDDHLAETDAPYDVTAGLGRLMEWMDEEVPRTRPIDDLDEGHVAGLHQAELLARRSDDAVRVLEERRLLLSELTARRTRSALLTLVMVVAFGLSAGALLAVAPHPTVAVVVAVSVIMALVTFAGVYLHRTTMQPLYVDLESAHETRTSDREVTGDTEPQTAPSDSVIHHTVDRPVTRYEGRQLSAWTGGRGFVPRVATTGLMALAIAGVVKGAYLPLLVVAMLLLTIIAGVIFPAIWSRDRDRRESAARLVKMVLAPELDDQTGALRKRATQGSRRRSVSERSTDEPLDEPPVSLPRPSRRRSR